MTAAETADVGRAARTVRGKLRDGLGVWSRRLERTALGGARRRRLQSVRGGRDVVWLPKDADNPLVTIRIATRDRPDLLLDRSLASALSQTYGNLEVLVIGDNASPATMAAMRSIKDPRVTFINLPGTRYPRDAHRRWLVQGHAPWNRGLELARGAWITSLDDDDEFTPNHVALLLAHAIDRRLEFVYGDTAVRLADGSWGLIGDWPPRYAGLTHGAALYSTRLRFLRYDPRSWWLGEATDWNLFRRMHEMGVRMGYVEEVVYRYYPARLVPLTRALPAD